MTPIEDGRVSNSFSTPCVGIGRVSLGNKEGKTRRARSVGRSLATPMKVDGHDEIVELAACNSVEYGVKDRVAVTRKTSAFP